jgi:hypothetical protein
MYVKADERHPGRPSMSDTMDIIALVPVSHKFELKDYFELETAKGKRKSPCLTVKYEDFHFKSTMACTYYGVQGHTVPRLIMCVDDDQVPALTYTDLYVGLTRVKDPDHIRCISFRSAIRNRTYLQKLEAKPHVESFFTSVPTDTIISKRRAAKAASRKAPPRPAKPVSQSLQSLVASPIRSNTAPSVPATMRCNLAIYIRQVTKSKAPPPATNQQAGPATPV